MTRADYQKVLELVSGWTPEDRIALAQDVLTTLRGDVSAATKARPRKSTLARALGLARGNGPVPSDADVARWIDEYRTEKYGR